MQLVILLCPQKKCVQFKIIMQPALTGLIVLLSCILPIWTSKECGLLDVNNKDVVPWSVNIYQHNEGRYEFICLGTVVSGKIIVTAARCFYDDLTQQIKNTTFAITTGQKHKAWNTNGDQNVQLREISRDNIFITPQYKGITDHYSCNIALVKLNKDQKFDKRTVKRACVYWDNDFVESQLEVNPQLQLTAWNDGDNPSLTTLKSSYINYDLCYSFVPTTFRPYLTFDKMCTEVNDLHLTTGFGSGLYALNTEKNRWYLIGIASEVTTSDSKKYITFIKIQQHLNWISNTAFLLIEQ